ncbi:hypothetical protein IXO151_01490, partial [Xanthomonas oryzae pv. oryzae]
MVSTTWLTTWPPLRSDAGCADRQLIGLTRAFGVLFNGGRAFFHRRRRFFQIGGLLSGALRQVVVARGADSTLIRNAVEDLLGEDFEGRFESKYLARTIVEPLLDPSQVRIGDGAE